MSRGTRSSRVLLSSVDTLTFYNDALTSYRRTSPVPQLECKGKPCKLYTPDVVQCKNVGGSGAEIEWKASCHSEIQTLVFTNGRS